MDPSFPPYQANPFLNTYPLDTTLSRIAMKLSVFPIFAAVLAMVPRLPAAAVSKIGDYNRRPPSTTDSNEPPTAAAAAQRAPRRAA